MSGFTVEHYGGPETLGPEWDRLFAAGPGPQTSRAWFTASAASALPAGAQPVAIGVRGPDGPAGLLPLVAGPGGRHTSLTTPYTCLYQPLLWPGTARRVAVALGRACRAFGLTLLEALDPDWPEFAPFCAGLGDAGLRTRRFEHFANWHEGVRNGWDRYLQTRPGVLRETIRRKTRLVEREPGMRLDWVQDPAALGPAMAAYEAVHARSWKQAEPHPRFNQALLETLGPTGMLRIGVLWAGRDPIAAQYWTVSDGAATVLKLAHDDAWRRFSPGTVLTAHAIRCLIGLEGVRELDFGRGDDPYKRAWAGERRQRIGLLAASPWSGRAALSLARHDAGRLARRSLGFLQTVKRRTRGVHQ